MGASADGWLLFGCGELVTLGIGVHPHFAQSFRPSESYPFSIFPLSPHDHPKNPSSTVKHHSRRSKCFHCRRLPRNPSLTRRTAYTTTMFVSKPRKVTLTLFCYLALLLAVTSVAQADSLNQPAARDHAALNRMLRKRTPDLFSGLGGTNGAAGDPPTFDNGSGGSSSSSGTSSASASSATSASSASQSESASAASSASSAASSSSSSASSAASSSSGTSSSSASSAASSQSSSLPASSSTPTSTPSQTQQSPDQQSDDNADTSPPSDSAPTSASRSIARVTLTATNTAPAETSAAAAQISSASSSIPKTAITIIIVIAACIGAVAVGWTIIRKWKFKPSHNFEDRMAPIDWQPTDADDSGIPGLRRNGSAASHGSFQSGSGHGDDNFAGRGVGGYGSDYGHGTSNLQPIPDHDFTAGAGAGLAPVGGYADLARGSSPQPQMAEMHRGPSMNRPGYDTYGAPAHPQGAYDYNGGRY